jgi:hypothetical protein
MQKLPNAQRHSPSGGAITFFEDLMQADRYFDLQHVGHEYMQASLNGAKAVAQDGSGYRVADETSVESIRHLNGTP